MRPLLTQSITTLIPRQAEMLALAQQNGRIGVPEMADHFHVSPQTIRKDLNEICERGLLQRIHGGAVVQSGVTNYGYDARRLLAEDEKRLIGSQTAALVPNGSSLFINIGTTTEQVAIALRDKRDLMVITNNINVVNILSSRDDFEIVLAGGIVRHTDGGIVGEAAVDFIRQFKTDYAIIGASAVDPDGSLLDYDYREVRVTQAIIENARRTLLVADKTKLDRTAPVRIAHVSQLDGIITDAPLSKNLNAACAEANVTVHIAGDDGVAPK